MEIGFSISNMTKHSMWSWLHPRQIKAVIVNRAAVHFIFAAISVQPTRELSRVFSDATATLITTAIFDSLFLLSHTFLIT